MSIAALSWAKKQKTGSPTRKAVLMALADYADHQGQAWPSVKRVAEDTELSDRAVRGALHELVESGLLLREDRRGETGVMKSAIYTFHALSDTVQDVQPTLQQVQGDPAGRAGGTLHHVQDHYIEPPVRTRVSDDTLMSDWPLDYREMAWKAYDKPVDKQPSLKALDDLKRSGKVPWAELYGGIARQAEHVERQYRPSLQRWIKREKWRDEFPETPRMNGSHRHDKPSVLDVLHQRIRARQEREGGLC